MDSFHRLLSRDRGDGKGSHFENPNEHSYRILRAFQNFTERLDSKLNRLEGRKMVTAYDAQGNKYQHEPKRWYEDRHNMGRFTSVNTPARKDLLNRLTEDTLKEGTRSAEPKAIFMMGGPASGKSTLLKQMFGGDPKGFLVLDPDAIKGKLPEFLFSTGAGVKSAAGDVHTTSSVLTRDLLDKAMGRKLNVLWDGTGNAKEFYEDKAAVLKKIRVQGPINCPTYPRGDRG